MPLVACPDCGRKVSTTAVACPQCGRPGPFVIAEHIAFLVLPPQPQAATEPIAHQGYSWLTQGSLIIGTLCLGVFLFFLAEASLPDARAGAAVATIHSDSSPSQSRGFDTTTAQPIADSPAPPSWIPLPDMPAAGTQLYLKSDHAYVAKVVRSSAQATMDDGTVRPGVKLRFPDKSSFWIPLATAQMLYVTMSAVDPKVEAAQRKKQQDDEARYQREKRNGSGGASITVSGEPSAIDEVFVGRENAKESVRAVLRDPESAVFTGMRRGRRINGGDGMVCGSVNSKNGFGAFTGPIRFLVTGDVVMLESISTSRAFVRANWRALCE